MTRLAWLFWFVCLAVFVYSYGFLDFNLTLTSNPLILKLLSPLQHLVYFDRPSSARLFATLFTALFVLYFVMLNRLGKAKIALFPWKKFAMIILVLVLAYPMLSYDVFNYLFHAKILWFYHQNPHLHAPLEYQGDLWLRFMRWVHTPSAYGPVFTLIESPAYLLGLGRFVPGLFLMKSTMAAFFVGCVYLIGRIGRLLGFSQANIVKAQLVLAFNPFLLLELVVNAHNDAVMIFFLLLAIYLDLVNKRILSYVSLMISVAVKYVTVILAWIPLLPKHQAKTLLITAALLTPVIFSPGRFQPWYLVWSIIPAVLINQPYSLTWISLASIGGVFYYLPYIYSGFWNNTPVFVGLILYLPLITTVVLTKLKNRD